MSQKFNSHPVYLDITQLAVLVAQTACTGLEQIASMAWVQVYGVPNNLRQDCC